MAIKNTLLRHLLIIFIASSFLQGCEKNQSNNGLPIQNSAKKYENTTTLQGAIRDNEGFVESGTVKVTTVGGTLITSTTLENSKNYRVEIPANTLLPLILSFFPNTAEPSTEKFRVVVIHPSITHYDINPLTTLIAKKAMSLGGYTDTNMRQAAENSSSISDPGKATAGALGNPTQHYGGWH